MLDDVSVPIIIEKLITTGNKQDFDTPITGEKGNVQPLDETMAALVTGDFSKSKSLFVNINSVIDVGDRVTIAGMKNIVAGEKSFPFLTLQHRQLLIEEKNVNS